MGTIQDLLSRLTELAWHPDSIEEARQAADECDLLLLRGRHTLETFTIKPGMPIGRAALMIRGQKGNSRIRLYIAPRATNRI